MLRIARLHIPSHRIRIRTPGELAAALWRQLLLWQQRERERFRLRFLDQRMLRDMGMTRAQVEREARKPFWRA